MGSVVEPLGSSITGYMWYRYWLCHQPLSWYEWERNGGVAGLLAACPWPWVADAFVSRPDHLAAVTSIPDDGSFEAIAEILDVLQNRELNDDWQ